MRACSARAQAEAVTRRPRRASRQRPRANFEMEQGIRQWRPPPGTRTPPRRRFTGAALEMAAQKALHECAVLFEAGIPEPSDDSGAAPATERIVVVEGRLREFERPLLCSQRAGKGCAPCSASLKEEGRAVRSDGRSPESAKRVSRPVALDNPRPQSAV